MTILLVRHGETEWNRERRFQDWLDFPLTARGIGQARAIGRWLAQSPERNASIVASPLGRARRTAEIIRDEIDRLGPISTLGAAGALLLDRSDCASTRSAGWTGSTHGEIEARAPGIFRRGWPP